MGIYGALSAAVSGLRAQAHALENISGNIANSQTIGFKRLDTGFRDLIPDAPVRRQTAGSVLAQSVATNTLQGDYRTVTNPTYIALQSSGFFVVEPPIGQSDGNAVFADTNFFTRRGDFDLDKNGYLVNGSGYHLKGLPVDPATGNISSSVPQVLKLSNSFLAASATTRIQYTANLPQMPQTNAYLESKAKGSELMRPQDFKTIANDTPAIAKGAVAISGAASTDFLAVGNTVTVKVGAGTPVTFSFTGSGGTSGTNIDLTASTTIDMVLAAMNSAAPGANFAIGSDGKLTATASGTTDTLSISGSTKGLGFATATAVPTLSPAAQASERVTVIKASDANAFFNQTISGGTATVYAPNGSSADLQLRWAKAASTEIGGIDTWNLFYLSDSTATGTQPQWTNLGTDYSFAADGTISPPVTETDLSAVNVNGVPLTNVKLSFGLNGLSQFNDASGKASIEARWDGYPAGQFSSVAINDAGRVVVSYDNGKQIEVAQVLVANFNAANQLKRMDGGVFAATSESGEPAFDSTSGVMSSALESSNTDISEEFTKLIVTQQAYSAGTRIVSSADEMMQEALNMVR